mmetsp:Transcript_80847/g.212239  ORF Transcript_80847/g.212239 Transcript_80847/m.212239 type:complete len:235 (+) Transcript_80847:3696-4400(+)
MHRPAGPLLALLDDAAVHGGRAVVPGDLALLDARPEGNRVEERVADQLASAEQRPEKVSGNAANVDQRHHVQAAVLGLEVPGLDDAPGARGKRPQRVRDGLLPAGGARGGQHEDRVVVLPARPRRRRLPLGHRAQGEDARAERLVRDQQGAGEAQLLRRPRAGARRGVDEHRLHMEEVEVADKLGLRAVGVQGAAAAEVDSGKDARGKRGAVLHANCNPRTRADPQSGEKVRRC